MLTSTRADTVVFRTWKNNGIGLNAKERVLIVCTGFLLFNLSREFCAEITYLRNNISRYYRFTHDRFSSSFNPVDSRRFFICTIIPTDADDLHFWEMILKVSQGTFSSLKQNSGTFLIIARYKRHYPHLKTKFSVIIP